MNLKNRWINFLLSNQKLDAGLFDILIYKKYSESHRAYHNLSHIEACLNLLDTLDISDKDQIELAIWFHDIIYDTQSSDNELNSANTMMSACLGTTSWSADYLNEVYNMILATKHSSNIIITSDKMKYFLDIDLSILGEPSEIFKSYDELIRKEYEWVPEDIYNFKRAEILQSFLDKDFIYHTQFFRDRYETQARVNINNKLRKI